MATNLETLGDLELQPGETTEHIELRERSGIDAEVEKDDSPVQLEEEGENNERSVSTKCRAVWASIESWVVSRTGQDKNTEHSDEEVIEPLEDMLGLPDDDLSDPPLVAQIFVCIIVCLVISGVIHRSFAESPRVFASNLCWKETFFLRLLGSYVCASLIGQSTMPLINRRFLASRSAFLKKDERCYHEGRGWIAIVLGAILLGIGAGLSLSLPETVFLQLPLTYEITGCCISGILVGATMFSVLERLDFFKSFLTKCALSGSAFVDQKYKLHYTKVALLAGLICLGLLRLFHIIVEDNRITLHPLIIRWNPYNIGNSMTFQSMLPLLTLILTDYIHLQSLNLVISLYYACYNKDSATLFSRCSGFILAILQFLLRCYCRTEFDILSGFKLLVDIPFSLVKRSSDSETHESHEDDLSQPLVEDRNHSIYKSASTEVQLIGSFLFGFLLLLVGKISHNYSLDSLGDEMKESPEVFLKSFFGMLIQVFGSLMCNSGWVRHVTGITDFRIASLVVVPISTFMMCVTSFLLSL